nr:MAG TPA: hypothetical protein [Caudoviricetes sp.]
MPRFRTQKIAILYLHSISKCKYRDFFCYCAKSTSLCLQITCQ